MADRKLIVHIVGDSRSLERAFKSANKAGSKFGRTMSTIGKVAVAGIAGGFVAFGLAMRAGFSELAEAQKVAAQTNAVLKSTGGIANVTAKHVDRLATSISRMSGIDDEAIAAAENMLLTFTNVRNETGKGNDVFDQATRASIDMATALGRDPVDSALMVGKALNDLQVTAQGNVRGFMALRRVGVQVSPEMMKMAAAFIQAGKPIEAQKLLLQELQTEFGGSAKAFGTTMPGALGKLSNAFRELMAAFATGFLPIILKVANTLTKKMADPAFVARVRELGTLIGTKLYNAFLSLSTWFEANWPAIQNGIRIVASIFRGLIGVIKFVNRVVDQLFLAILGGIRAILKAASYLPGFLGGGKAKGGLEAVDREIFRISESHRAKPKYGKKPMTGGGFAPGRQHGGRVMRGASYTVGERGPELFTPGASGAITPGGGGTIVVPVYLDGREIARVVTPHLQRSAKSIASQQRGRHGGSRLATN